MAANGPGTILYVDEAAKMLAIAAASVASKSSSHCWAESPSMRALLKPAMFVAWV
jgi:hypothetical protein